MTRTEATNAIHPCKLCGGKPFVRYDPGCSFTTCIHMKEDCPCVNAAPDDELELLVERVNADVDAPPRKTPNQTEG